MDAEKENKSGPRVDPWVTSKDGMGLKNRQQHSQLMNNLNNFNHSGDPEIPNNKYQNENSLPTGCTPT